MAGLPRVRSSAAGLTLNRVVRSRSRIVGEFFRAVVEQACTLKLLSDEHFTDGTLVERGPRSRAKRKDAGAGEPPEPLSAHALYTDSSLSRTIRSRMAHYRQV